ncbi:MAG: nucleotide pyrophosphohydrolase, partial [Acholeplasmataceae bacterium]|nr:nucleotide pyrophosphohydrolase [Acholeplasmataceae bacterium]
PNTAGVLQKIEEELKEVAEAVAEKDNDHVEWEIGDVLFAIANYARHLGIEPETALNRANNRFVARFNFIEHSVLASGRNWADFSLVELEKLWQEAKKSEKN